MWPFGKRIESVFRTSFFLEAKALIINYENRVRGKVDSAWAWKGPLLLCRLIIGCFFFVIIQFFVIFAHINAEPIKEPNEDLSFTSISIRRIL